MVLSTISRFHTFHLARQLQRRDVLAHLYTGLPRWKVRTEGIPANKITTFPYLQTVYEALPHLGVQRYPLRPQLEHLAHRTLDRYVARHLPPADIFHALSYCGLQSGRVAQRRGAIWICDSPTAHERFNDDILHEEYERAGVARPPQPAYFLEYAEATYREADAVTVGSTFARNTFIRSGVPAESVHVVPYGADLGLFQPRGRPFPGHFSILFAGQFIVRKGAHDLLEAVRLAAIPGASLTVVGPVPHEGQRILRASTVPVNLVGPKSRAHLADYYSTSDVLVLPSVSEGLALVQAEALACGCPLIATENTGAGDLFVHGQEGFIVPIRSPSTIAEKLVWLYEHPEERAQMRLAAAARAATLAGWDAYGTRLLSLYRELVTDATGIP